VSTRTAPIWWIAFICFTAIIGAGLVAVSRAGALLVEKQKNEQAAIASLRKIVQAQAAYASECGRGHYASGLMDLATRPPDKPEGYLSWRRGELGHRNTAPVQGYLFTIFPDASAAAPATDCNDFPTQTRFYVAAVPLTQGVTGDRTFATNQKGVIWANEWLPPPREPFGPPSRPVR
jgi:hypothetical protein